MSDSSNIDNPNAPQLAAANPAANVDGARDADVAPASPGVGFVVAQATGTGVVPDLTLLDLEVLLNLDPTANPRSIGQSLEIQPLRTVAEDSDLPADLTSVDLSQLLELGLAGEQLPSLAEIADLPAPSQGNEVAKTFQGEAEVSLPEQAQAAVNAETGGATDNANPVAELLLDGKGKPDHELKSEADFDLDVLGAHNTPPADAPSDNPSTESPGNGNGNGGGSGSGSQNAQASGGASNGQGNGPGSNNGQGSGSNIAVAANNNAGGNSGGNAGGIGNSNSGNSGNSGNSNSNGSEIVLASISFPGGGDLPASIALDDVPSASGPRSADSTPAASNAASLAPSSSAASTFVSSSDAESGPGNSDFGAGNGNGAGNGFPGENLPVADIAPTSSGSNAPIDVPIDAPQGVSLSGGGGIDVIIGTGGDDDLRGKGGNDTIDGLAGEDTIDGGGGKDSLIGGDDADELIGKGGSDTLEGGAGDDTLNGGGGSDFLDGGVGFDDLIGGGGADILVWDFADLNIDGGGNTDTLRVDGGDADIAAFGGTISGIEYVDLETDAGANTLTVSYADVLAMTDNSDTLVIDGSGLDSVDAGAGWTDGGVSGGYHAYTQGSGPNTATLLVDTDITNVLV